MLGAHTLINRAQTNTELLRGYSLFLEILEGFRAAVILPFDAEAVAIFDRMRAKRVRVATMDLRIAAIALSQNLTLLTRNTGDFSKVPGLVTEDWSK